MISVQEILRELKGKANPDNVKGMARYGMTSEKRLGVSVPNMRMIAKKVGKKHELALELWKTGIPEAKIVAAMVGEPEKLTEEQMEDWVKEIDSWDICDQVCMNLFEKTPLARKKIFDWSEREEEFVKRTAFALIACLAWHDKKAEDAKIIEFLSLIKREAAKFIEFLSLRKREATDERNFVKKAVNWALRTIGKRNPNLNKAAVKAAKEIQDIDSKTARWIASNAIKELESDAVQRRLKQKATKLAS
jgi:3-methyladenine DNA glycosylase AlkD